MTIGIIGAGSLGSNVAKALAKKGIPVMISNSRGPETLAALAQELGSSVKATTVDEASKADIVFIGVQWKDIPAALSGVSDWSGRILIDSSNPLEQVDPSSPEGQDPNNPLGAYGLRAVDTNGRQSSEIIRDLAPGARVVKAFNHIEMRFLNEPVPEGGQRVIFYSGDNDEAKAEIRDLIHSIDLFPIDLGGLTSGGALASMPAGSLAAINLVRM